MHLSREVFRTYERKGVIAPAAKDETGYYKFFTLDDMQTLSLAETMREGGMTYDEIAEAMALGGDNAVDQAYRQAADEIRRVRRRLKAIVNLERKIADYRPIQSMGASWYVRYLPQRWMAVMPLAGRDPAMVDHVAGVRGYRQLRGVVETVGWSLTESFGTMLSMQAAGAEASRYAFIELASPPMPVVTGSRVVDGGCYHVIDPERCNPGCDGSRCFECARFGREPLASKKMGVDEPREWREAAEAAPWQWDRTLMAQEALAGAEEADAGPWAEYLNGLRAAAGMEAGAEAAGDGRREGCGRGGRPGQRGGRQGGQHKPLARPQRMPHEVRLPLGVSACVLPAGMYLCKRFDAGDWDAAAGKVLNRVSRLARCSAEDAVPRSGSEHGEGFPGGGWGQRGHEAGPFIEPFAAPRSFGDPSLAGWHRKIAAADFKMLRLPERCALPPEDGFVVVAANEPLPLGRKSVRQELQVLVDANAFLG